MLTALVVKNAEGPIEKRAQEFKEQLVLQSEMEKRVAQLNEEMIGVVRDSKLKVT